MKQLESFQNTGFIPTPTTVTDLVVGSVKSIPYQEVLPSGDWTKYLPSDEFQQNGGLETMACCTFSASNCLEMQLNRLLIEDLIPDNILNEFKALNYFDANGLFNFSDRFIAKLSNTTPAGNTMPNVWSAKRHYGMLGEADWPSVWTNWTEYYQGIPQALKDKALKFLDYFDIQNEYVTNGGHFDLSNAEYQLKQAPLQIATAVCSGWNSAPVIQTCNLPVAHATAIYNADSVYYDFDSYDPFRKKLAGNYAIPYVYKGLVTPKFNLKKKGETIMPRLLRKKNEKEVFFELEGVERYWIKEAEDFEKLKTAGVIGDWSSIQEVDLFTTPYTGKIIGSANFSDILRIVFGSVR
jgi:hypothetical protein